MNGKHEIFGLLFNPFRPCMQLFFFTVWSETRWESSPEQAATFGGGSDVRGWPVLVAAPAIARRKKSCTGERRKKNQNNDKGINVNSYN